MVKELLAVDATTEAPGVDARSVKRHHGSQALWPWVAVIGTYVVIGVVAYWPVFPRLWQSFLVGENDFQEFMWFMVAVTHGLTHGSNPFFSNALFAPTGVNLAQNNTSPLLDVIIAPVTLTAGPVVSANLLILLAMPVSATAAFIVLRRWHLWWPAAAIGGLIYGFSPYMVGQSLGHPELSFLPLPPFIALTVVSILQGRGSSVRLGVQLGLLVTAQYLISEEVMATVAIVVVAGVVCVAIRHPTGVPRMFRTAAGATAIAFALAAVLLAYPVWMTLAGPQHFTGPNFSTSNPYHNDLLSFIVPGPMQKVALSMQSLQSRVLGYNDPTEAGGYIGVPALVLMAIFAWRSRRSPRMQLTVVLLLVAAVLSLGPHLTVDGHLTSVPLPFLLLDHVTPFYDIFSGRISLEMDACIAALIAFGLDDMRSAPHRTRGDARAGPLRSGPWTSVFFACLTLVVLVVTQLPDWPYGGGSNTPLPTRVAQAIPSGDPIAITYPYDTAFVVGPMVWQAEDGMRFRLMGGYAYHAGPDGGSDIFPAIMHPEGLQHFLGAQEGAALYGPPLRITPGLIASSRTALSRYDIRVVIVDRSLAGSGPVMELFTDVLGPPKLSTGQYSLWASDRAGEALGDGRRPAAS